MEIAKYISELLFQHDSVVLPGFGGFISHRESVKVEKEGIAPPSKKLEFSTRLKNNDYLLARHIAKSENITLIKANNHIKDHVKNLIANLKSGKKVVLNKIGTLSLDSRNVIIFEADESVNYLAESFGLASVDAGKATVAASTQKTTDVKPIEKKEIRTTSTTTTTTEKKLVAPPAIKSEKKKSYAVIWLLIILIPIIVLCVLAYLNMDYVKKTYAGLFPADSTSSEEIIDVYDTIENADTSSFLTDMDDDDDDGNDEIADNNNNNSNNNSEVESKVNIDKNSDDYRAVTKSDFQSNNGVDKKKRYFVIAGAFTYKSNAEKYVNQLKRQGYKKSEVVGKTLDKNLWVVSYNGYVTREEANSRLREVNYSINPHSWILHKVRNL